MLSLVFSAVATVGHAKSKAVDLKIQSLVNEVKTQERDARRVEAARQLSAFVKQQDRKAVESISDESLRAIASLLKDRSDIVVAFAAITLGDIGPPAKPVRGALQAAIDNVGFAVDEKFGKFGVSSNAVLDMRRALKKISGESEVGR